MIPITQEQALAYCKKELDETIEWIGGEYTISIDDIYDLHDHTIESIDIDALYYTLLSLLPQIVDECSVYVDEAQEYVDDWGEYYRVVFGH